MKIQYIAGPVAPIFLAVASNLLRDYSLQDPQDLRIRRRKSPLPETPFVEALLAACAQSIERIEAAQAVLGTDLPPGLAVERDITTVRRTDIPRLFDAAITRLKTQSASRNRRPFLIHRSSRGLGVAPGWLGNIG